MPPDPVGQARALSRSASSPGGPSSARAARAALRPSGAELTPPDPVGQARALSRPPPRPPPRQASSPPPPTERPRRRPPPHSPSPKRGPRSGGGAPGPGRPSCGGARTTARPLPPPPIPPRRRPCSSSSPRNPDTGFRIVAPWIEPDPGIAHPALTLAERRAMLAADGARLPPGSGGACGGSRAGGACENGYREAVVFADVDLPAGATTASVDPTLAPPPRFSAAVRVSGAEPLPVAQHAPRVAARGGRVYVVWHEARAGLENVFLAVSRNRGRSFAPPIRVSDHPAGAVAELNPAIAVRGGRVLVVWQELAAGRNDDAGRIALARFDARGTKHGPDVRVDDHDGGGKWVPAIALVGHDPVVAWVDERDAGFAGEPVEHLYAARGHDGGTTFDPAVRVDAGATDPLAAHLDNKWGPTLATARNAVYAA